MSALMHFGTSAHTEQWPKKNPLWTTLISSHMDVHHWVWSALRSCSPLLFGSFWQVLYELVHAWSIGSCLITALEWDLHLRQPTFNYKANWERALVHIPETWGRWNTGERCPKEPQVICQKAQERITDLKYLDRTMPGKVVSQALTTVHRCKGRAIKVALYPTNMETSLPECTWK